MSACKHNHAGPSPCHQCRDEWREGELAPARGSDYRANFLWPHNEGSIEEAGYEFANAKTEAYRKQWWEQLLRLARMHIKPPNAALCDGENET